MSTKAIYCSPLSVDMMGIGVDKYSIIRSLELIDHSIVIIQYSFFTSSRNDTTYKNTHLTGQCCCYFESKHHCIDIYLIS